jgi:hypothetical protein
LVERLTEVGARALRAVARPQQRRQIAAAVNPRFHRQIDQQRPDFVAVKALEALTVQAGLKLTHKGERKMGHSLSVLEKGYGMRSRLYHGRPPA